MAHTPPTPAAEPNVTQRYQPPQGAIPVAKIKRVLIGLGLCTLAFLTIWGASHKPSVAADAKTTGTPILPTSSSDVDSQQAELSREMDEARRAAQEAELAKQRAQHMMQGDTGPHNAQVDPAAQLRAQLALDDLRRQHQAAFASTVAFAAQGGREAPNREVSPSHLAASSSLDHEELDHTARALGATAAEGQTHTLAPPSPAGLMQTPESTSGSYRLDEGTILESILLNRLDGEFVGPVIAQISANVYSRAGLELLIPKGSRLLGEAKEVNSFDQRRLAILFHRLILPNGKSISLDKFRGLDQIGETGVVSKIDHHYLEIFGTSLALGAIGGLSQIGNYGGGGGYDPTTGFRIGFTERMGASSEQVLSKFLNKLPTIQALEGTRIKVILTNDLTVEAYE